MGKLTALNFDVTQLPVHGEVLQVHRARRRDGEPADMHISVVTCAEYSRGRKNGTHLILRVMEPE